MQNYECGNQNVNNHVNAFVDLNGIPYLLSEYLDRNEFQQIDRSLIKSEIIVDQSESMRAVVDISIDDIGKRASDGYPAIVGNTTKQANLIRMISDNYQIMNHQLNVFRRGIVIRVDYQLENYRTRQVIRSMTESFRIMDRNYFLDINPRDTSDNAIIVNFCNTLISTINEFTHGQDPMMIRITNIHLSYEMVKVAPHMPRITQSMMGKAEVSPLLPTHYSMENNMYRYHDMMQNRHFIPGWDPYDCLPENPDNIMPNSWSMFNRFYRFDNNGADIILHDQEINNPMTKVALVPCGVVRINRTFMINPGHRIIFKFSIWKNDVTVVTDTSHIAQALRAPLIPKCNCDHNHRPPLPVAPPKHNCGCSTVEPPPPPNHVIDPDYETLLRLLHESRDMEYQQNQVINQLTTQLSELTTIVQTLVSKEDETPEDEEPVTPPDDSVNQDEVNEELKNNIDDLGQGMNNLQQTVEDLPNVYPIPEDTIKNIVDTNSQVAE